MEKVMDPSYSRDDVSDEEEQQFTYAMQLASLPMLTMVMKAVVELQVLEIIAKAGPRAQLSSFEIALQLPVSTTHRCNPNAPKMLDRMLQLLASHSILTCSILPCNHDTLAPLHTRLYGLAPVAKYFIPTEKDVSFGPWLCLGLDMVFMASGDELKAAVVEGGIPFERAHGMHAFEYLGKHPKLNEVFNKAMISHTTIAVKKILQSSYKGFEQVQKLVDVGGNLGVALNLITSKYPHIKAFNFDLPHVIQHAPSYPGVEHVGGDMFESVPKGDAIFMKWILHDWSDDHCLDLLKNCHKALPDDGKIIVVEAVLPLKPNDSTSTKSILQLDVGMMTQSPGGKERTQQEFLALAIGAGFSSIKLECFVSNLWVMEFYK